MRGSMPPQSHKPETGAPRVAISEGRSSAEGSRSSRQAPDPVLTVCPFCACGCGLYMQRTEHGLAGVTPSEHHPVSGGRLCARGWAAHEASLWGDRLTQPLVRSGGSQEPSDWRTAMKSAAERLGSVLATGGAVGVLGSGRATNEENFLAAGLARGILRTNHIDSSLRSSYQALLSGVCEVSSGRGLTSALDDLERCEVILLLEGDLTVTHPRVALAIMRAVQQGARLVTLGAVKTQMSRLAWLHLPLIPGDEPVLVARLAAAAEGEARNMTSRLDSAKSSAGEPPVNPSHLMTSADIRRAVESYGEASRAGIVLAPTGAEEPWLRAMARGFSKLAESTGHLRRPGSVLLPLPIRANTRGALEMGVAPNRLSGLCAIDNEAAQWRLRRVWGSESAIERGLDVEEMIGEVSGLIVLADDPPVALPLVGAARRAMADLDCLIVLDAFVTPTVEVAHVAFPISSLAETDGTITNMEGRVQRFRASTPPPGDARPGWWALTELAAALGRPRRHESAYDVLRDILTAVPSYPDALCVEGEDRESEAGVLSGHFVEPHARAVKPEEGAKSILGSLGVPRVSPGGEVDFPFRLVRVSVFEWGDDPLTNASPTLRRESDSRRKRFPDGVVEMNAQEASAMGIREGWRIKLRSLNGEAVVPVHLRADLVPGVMLVPFGCRHHLEPVMGGRDAVGVSVERT